MNTPNRTIALARILTGVMFLFLGEFKVASSAFAHGGFQKYLQSYIGVEAVPFYGRLLARFVMPHAVFFAYTVGVLELAIGASLLLGLWVRPFSVLGMLHMLNLTLATWHGAGQGPMWHYVANQLDHIPLLLLFAIFFTTYAGEVWGIDGLRGSGRR
jgi:uncharacterized membrane protein YphA (DoxX/SURF4 family)